MTRRCSHCSHNGHNSRTCPSRAAAGAASGGVGVKLFGVRLTDGSIMKKSASMGNLSALYHSSSAAAAVSPNPTSPAAADPVEGYLSDDPAHASCSAKRRADRKKGTPWTEEEHRLFLLGLQKLGKGDWRGIARNFVLSRTPTQVASHAQKYFMRQCSVTRRKRRSSLFDMAPDMTAETPVLPEDHFMLPPQAAGTDLSDNSQYSLKLSLRPNSDQSMEPALTPTKPKEETKKESPTIVTVTVNALPPIMPAFYPAYIPVPFPLWPSPVEEANNKGAKASPHQVLKPIPVIPKEPMNVDELVGMSSQLSLKDTEPSPLSLKLLGEPSRQSAFHASSPAGTNKGGL